MRLILLSFIYYLFLIIASEKHAKIVCGRGKAEAQNSEGEV